MSFLHVALPHSFIFCGADFGSMIALDLQQKWKNIGLRIWREVVHFESEKFRLTLETQSCSILLCTSGVQNQIQKFCNLMGSEDFS